MLDSNNLPSCTLNGLVDNSEAAACNYTVLAGMLMVKTLEVLEDEGKTGRYKNVLPSSSSTWYCDAAPSSAMVVEQQSKSGWTKMILGVRRREASLASGDQCKQR